MRLTPKQQKAIKKTFLDIFQKGKIYLFGSRVDNSKRDGDIDLFIVAKDSSIEQKTKALTRLKRALHKPVDIVLHRDFSRDIEQEGLKGVVI